MTHAARAYGLVRSLLMYYGMPFRGVRMRRLYAPFVGPGSLCFDVGAHAGNRVRCFRALGARVVAVEPQRDFVRLLSLLFGRDEGVTILPMALGAAPGTGELHVSPRTPTVTTLSPEWIGEVRRDASFRRVTWTERERVEITTLDALIAEHGRPAFIKIDVEGYEAQVLAGLSSAVDALSFEYLPAARHVALECVDRLQSLGRYEYNWSPGESHALASPRWLDAAGIRAFLEGLTPAAGSGDVYARLVA
ncbi:MAG TPA: FkbM family methyltransferase [Gammaproteobacteria bacterium]